MNAGSLLRFRPHAIDGKRALRAAKVIEACLHKTRASLKYSASVTFLFSTVSFCLQDCGLEIQQSSDHPWEGTVKRIQPWQAIVFAASLWLIAIAVNTVFGISPPEPERQVPQYPPQAYSTPAPAVPYSPPPPARVEQVFVPQPMPQPEVWRPPPKSPEEIARERAATEHANLLSRYREPGLTRESDRHMVAILAGTDDGKICRSIATALAQKLACPQVRIVSSVFTPQFFSDGLLQKAMDDAPAIAQKLDLTDILDSIVVGRESIEYSTDSSLENLVTASIRLEVIVFSLRTQDSKSWTFTTSGAGFKQAEARQAGEERLAKQISRDTKMALNL